jgi:hypothetical protein
MIKSIILALLILVGLPYALSGETTGSYAIPVGSSKESQKATKKTEPSDVVVACFGFNRS